MYANLISILCFLMENKKKVERNLFLLKSEGNKKLHSLKCCNMAMAYLTATPSESATPLKNVKVGEQVQNNTLFKFGDGEHTDFTPRHFAPKFSIVRWVSTRDQRQILTVVIQLSSIVPSKSL